MIRKTFIFCILISLFAFSILGCGQNNYYDERLKMRVQRLDSDLEGRWSTNGVIITEITPGGPAHKSGLEEGELISYLVGEREIKKVRDYKSAIKKAMKKDRKAKLVFSERQEPVEVSVRKAGESLGLKVKNENQRVTVAKVAPKSAADLSGIKVGDVILKVIDEKQIETLKDYKKAVKEIAKYSNSLVVHTIELSGIKLAAIEALGNIGDNRSLDALMAALESDEVFMRRPAAQALEKFSEKGITDERLVDLMIKHLQAENEPDSEIRRSSAVILGRLKSTKAIPYLIAALEDEIPGVRFKAGLALANIGPDAVDALIDSLQSGNPSVQNIAASALGDIGGGKARQALIRALKQISEPTVKLTIADALAKVGGEYALSVLKQTQESTNDLGLKVFIEELLVKSM
ncbi:TPA: PDZ domain-containing protein [Candidatus Poribacteria bacterium]|nr:PDZ domain-containing protein [Candidatus Poribacteria bacterium]